MIRASCHARRQWSKRWRPWCCAIMHCANAPSRTKSDTMAAGSPLWQTIFISFALVLIAFQVVRGWRLGVVRQMVRLLALVSAYAAGLFGGRMLLPLLRPILRVPDLLIKIGRAHV